LTIRLESMVDSESGRMAHRGVFDIALQQRSS
jgi:hypothetical protein